MFPRQPDSMDALSLCSNILDHLKALRVRIDKFKNHPQHYRALVHTHDLVVGKLQELNAQQETNTDIHNELNVVNVHITAASRDLDSLETYLGNPASHAPSSSNQQFHQAQNSSIRRFFPLPDFSNLRAHWRTFPRTNRIGETLSSVRTNLNSAWDIVHEIRLVRIEKGVNDLQQPAYNLSSSTKSDVFVPPESPTDIQFKDVSESAFTLTWETPLDEQNRIQAFEVACRKTSPDADASSVARQVISRVSARAKSFRIVSLEPATLYNAKVRSVCLGGRSEWSVGVNVKTTHPFREEYNVLLLGETGVGKSTFINAFTQYLWYETLNDAKKGGLIPVIPTAFTVTIDGELKTVSVGDEHGSGESISVSLSGQSCTQNPKSYVIVVKTETVSCRLQLIDTPGIGDTRGPQYDKDNLRNILAYIDNLDELHGILVLMKPNDSRLTIAMKYCMKELLRHLHKSAADILMFVFTNARSTFYEPGDTLIPLRKILRDIKDSSKVDIKANRETMFCVDSESFRFLAARMNGISFHSARDADFKDSWEKSSQTCRKIFQRIRTLEPHEVKETTTLNEVRNNIIRMSRPLVLISDTIRRNLKIIEEDKKEINEVRGEIEVLKQRQFEEFIELQPENMEKPRTVCTHEDCTHIEMVSGSHMKVPNRSCHEPCYLQNVPIRVIGDVALAHCASMEHNSGLDTATCCCRHSFKLHMHEAVKYVQVKRNRMNETTNKRIQAKSGDILGKQSIISRLESEKKEWEEEEAVVLKTMAMFAHFLNHNGILSINDAMEEYITYQIRVQEEIKAALPPGQSDQVTIDALKENLRRYQAEKKILEEAFQDQRLSNVGNGTVSALGDLDGGVVGIRGAKKAMKKLMDLPHVGASVQKAMNAERKATENQISLQQFRVPVPWHDGQLPSQSRRPRTRPESQFWGLGWFSSYHSPYSQHRHYGRGGRHGHWV